MKVLIKTIARRSLCLEVVEEEERCGVKKWFEEGE